MSERPHSAADGDRGEEQDAHLRRCVETWRVAGPELERLRRSELGCFDFEANTELIDSMLEAALQHAEPRVTSGLVEYHRRLAPLHAEAARVSERSAG